MDYYADLPKEITVDVKPSLDIIKNAARYFKQARKLERGIPHQQQRLKAARNLQQEVDRMEADIQIAEAKLVEMQSAMTDPSLASSAGKLLEASKKVQDAQNVVDRLYARWEELEGTLV